MSVDTNGLVIRALVCAADISDSESGMWLLLNHPDTFPNMHTLRVDLGIEQTHAHSFWGLCARLHTKLPIDYNRQFGVENRLQIKRLAFPSAARSN